MTVFKLLRPADAFTLANAALGFLAITYISDGKYTNAEVLLLFAVVADGLDGIVARRFGGGKESLGDYLDIMADYLSFCVAPAILFYQVYFNVAETPSATLPQDILVGVAAGLLVSFGLLRLARHVAIAGPAAGRFTGLPTTAAGLFTVLLISVGGLGDILSALLVAGVAVLMITEIPYPKVRGTFAVASGALVVAPAAALVFLPAATAPQEVILLAALAAASAYVCSGFSFALLRIPLGHADAEPVREAPVPPDEASQEVDPGA